MTRITGVAVTPCTKIDSNAVNAVADHSSVDSS
jgi:hypothetical protein